MHGQEHMNEPVLAYARKDFARLDERFTVQQAFEAIRQQGVGEKIVYFYVVDEEGHLRGVLPTRRLLTAPLEPTNEPYAIAKIAGIKLCEAYRRQYGDDFISAMPTNLYGPNDNFDLESSHVLPALMRKFHDAKVRGHRDVCIWGTGLPRREYPPPTGLRIGLDKIWSALDRELARARKP